MTVEELRKRLFKQWGIGKKGEDPGVLVLLATQDHNTGQKSATGWKRILPDGKVGGFGREMVPICARTITTRQSR